MGMSDTGRFLKNKEGDYINPFTRQPLNEGTINKINELLVLSGRETLSTLEFIPFEEFGYDAHRYYLYLLLLLEHKDLTISDQKKVIIKFSELLHSNFNSFNEQDKGKTWKIVNGKVVIMTPSGWLLPTDMLYKDWQNAGISLDELNEMIREEQERLSLRPRRLVFDFGKKRRRVLSKVTKPKRVSKAKKPKGSKQPKGPWVNICRKVDGKHPPCGRPEASDRGYPKCRAVGVAGKMSDSQKKAACAQKRKAEKTHNKTGTGNKPKMVSYKPKKKNESISENIKTMVRQTLLSELKK
jgi:hypothetical protein